MSILIEDQLEIVATTKKYGIIVLEAIYDEHSLHWDWCINGVETGHRIFRHNADSLIRNKEITAKLALKEMIDDVKKFNNKNNWGGLESKQIRHQPFKNRYTIELVKRLAADVYPELLI